MCKEKKKLTNNSGNSPFGKFSIYGKGNCIYQLRAHFKLFTRSYLRNNKWLLHVKCLQFCRYQNASSVPSSLNQASINKGTTQPFQFPTWIYKTRSNVGEMLGPVHAAGFTPTAGHQNLRIISN